ncbi:pyridoxamine 5'-phosphate oxidase family protein [Halobellus captivus]|uniref:pyridoxamine 5'-phosphate oxidase family protein n=1 Tax=Halobellus captivus TaxID=2592614 RepID=UPI0011A87E56|nr:pyridoxamine 5'-phosphate oxidase family protein [Halobellus captivus]
MKVTGAWSRPELTGFLDAARVPIRLACHTPSGHLWMLSLWYLWTEGDVGSDRDGTTASEATPELRCATSADADVVTYLRNDPAVAFEVSTNDPPYRGVRGRGTANIEPDGDKILLRTLLDRYLGGTDNDLSAFLLDPDREEVRIRITPERLHSWDFTDRMADITAPDGVSEE